MKRLTKKEVVEVAKDVLKLMSALEVRSTYGYLAHWRDGVDHHAAAHQFDGDEGKLQSKIPLIAKNCAVCAQGAMVLAHIHLYDGVEELPDNNDANEMAMALFPQADLIEAVFEHPSDFQGNFSTLEDKPRLRAIMKNIIANKGVLKVRRNR